MGRSSALGSVVGRWACSRASGARRGRREACQSAGNVPQVEVVPQRLKRRSNACGRRRGVRRRSRTRRAKCFRWPWDGRSNAICTRLEGDDGASQCCVTLWLLAHILLAIATLSVWRRQGAANQGQSSDDGRDLLERWPHLAGVEGDRVARSLLVGEESCRGLLCERKGSRLRSRERREDMTLTGSRT